MINKIVLSAALVFALCSNLFGMNDAPGDFERGVIEIIDPNDGVIERRELFHASDSIPQRIDAGIRDLAPEEIFSLVCDIQEKLGITNHSVLIQVVPNGGASIRRLKLYSFDIIISIGKKLVEENNQEVLKFVIGHELAHIISGNYYYDHVDNILLFGATSYCYRKFSLFLIFSMFLSATVTGGGSLLTSLLFWGLILQQVVYWAILHHRSSPLRKEEYRCDECAAIELNCAEGGIQFFKDDNHFANRFFRMWNDNLHHHPSAYARIKRLQRIAG